MSETLGPSYPGDLDTRRPKLYMAVMNWVGREGAGQGRRNANPVDVAVLVEVGDGEEGGVLNLELVEDGIDEDADLLLRKMRRRGGQRRAYALNVGKLAVLDLGLGNRVGADLVHEVTEDGTALAGFGQLGEWKRRAKKGFHPSLDGSFELGVVSEESEATSGARRGRTGALS